MHLEDLGKVGCYRVGAARVYEGWRWHGLGILQWKPEMHRKFLVDAGPLVGSSILVNFSSEEGLNFVREVPNRNHGILHMLSDCSLLAN